MLACISIQYRYMDSFVKQFFFRFSFSFLADYDSIYQIQSNAPMLRLVKNLPSVFWIFFFIAARFIGPPTFFGIKRYQPRLRGSKKESVLRIFWVRWHFMMLNFLRLLSQAKTRCALHSAMLYDAWCRGSRNTIVKVEMSRTSRSDACRRLRPQNLNSELLRWSSEYNYLRLRCWDYLYAKTTSRM